MHCDGIWENVVPTSDADSERFLGQDFKAR